MADFSGPYSRKTEYLDQIADILKGEDDLIHNFGDRQTFALQRLAEFITGEGAGKYKNVQSDWNAEPGSEAAILNKPDGIPVDPAYVHTDENFTTFHREKLENIEAMAEVNVQSDWTETDPESDAYIRNVPKDLVRDADYVHTDNNFDDSYVARIEKHLIISDTQPTDEENEIWVKETPYGGVLIPTYEELQNLEEEVAKKADAEIGKGFSTNDFTDELKLKLECIEPNANRIVVDADLSPTSNNPVENRTVTAALETKVDKVEGKALSDENFTRAEKLKLEAIEAQANRTIPDENITATSRNVVESKAIYEALETKVNKVNGKALSANDFTDAYRNKLDNIEDYATNTIIEPSISNVSDNPVRSRAIYEALMTKVDKVEGKELSDNNFTDEEKILLSKFNPDAPKITICRLIMDQETGEPAGINLTWQQCKDAIANGVLYYQKSNGDSETISLCYSVETELRNGVPAYRVEFSDFDSELFEYFEASAANAIPSYVGSRNFRPDMTVKVDKTTTVNGHALDTDVVVTPSDIAYSHTQTYEAGSVGAALNHLRSSKADKATKVNGHTLEDDVTVTASDIAFDAEDTYEEGSIGEHVKELTEASGELGDNKVDKTTTVNGHTLEDDVTVTASDIAFDSEDTYEEGSLGAQVKELVLEAGDLGDTKVDKTTTVNGHALDTDVVVEAGDIEYSDEVVYTEGSVGEAIKNTENIVIVSDTQPTAENNKIWAKENPDGAVQIATYGELQALEAVVDGKVDAENGKALSTNDYTDAEKAKLAGIAAGAQVNVLETVKVNGTALVSDGRKAVDVTVPTKLTDLENDGDFVRDGDYVHTDNNYTTAEKNKLRDIEEGGQVNIIETVKVNGTAQTVTNKEVDLFVPTKTSEITNDSDFVSHADLSDAAPQMDGTAASGSSQDFSRADHVHPTDTSRAPLDSPALTGTPTAPTAETGNSSTRIATTAFVADAVSVKANADNVYTKAEVDAKVASVYRLKGAKNEVTDLPSENNTTGDVWHVNADGAEYFWNGSAWEFLGKVVDLTGYVYDPDYVHTDNNLTDSLKSKLEGIETGAQVNVRADWNASNGDAQILNKPMINNVELVGGNNSLQSLGIDIAEEQSIDALFE